jgi:hypothetical protein
VTTPRHFDGPTSPWDDCELVPGVKQRLVGLTAEERGGLFVQFVRAAGFALHDIGQSAHDVAEGVRSPVYRAEAEAAAGYSRHVIVLRPDQVGKR